MSSIRTLITRITGMRKHTDPEVVKLEIATVKGWNMCVPIGRYKVGDRVVYFERGTTIPEELAERLGIMPYVSKKLDITGERVLVIHEVKLRGEPSFGLAIDVPPELADMPDETDVSAEFGAAKYQPPARVGQKDAADNHPLFPRYTDIEDLRSYPNVFNSGSHVVVSEKIHGTNCRVGFVRNDDGSIENMAGGRTLRRLDPAEGITDPEDRAKARESHTYWHPWSIPGVSRLMRELDYGGHKQAILFGEIYGRGVQFYNYGRKNIGFTAFDLMIDSEYVGYRDFIWFMNEYEIDRVPALYVGLFDMQRIIGLSNGETKMTDDRTHGREGVVIRPYFKEVRHEVIGRPVLKCVGDEFTFSKRRGQDTTDV